MFLGNRPKGNLCFGGFREAIHQNRACPSYISDPQSEDLQDHSQALALKLRAEARPDLTNARGVRSKAVSARGMPG